jgi:hypothetical protein
MASLWSDENRFSTMLEVEILAVEAWSLLGVVPADDVAVIRERTAGMITADDVAAIEARERITNHDVAAFVDIVAARVGQPAGGWVHYGLTSSDVTDTALSLTLSRAAGLLIDAATALEGAIADRARELRDMPMVGRTHGIHAEPTTMGAKLALWALQVRRDRERLVRARHAVSVGKLSGAVGTYSNVDPTVERYVCQRLGLRPVPATQVLARDGAPHTLRAYEHERDWGSGEHEPLDWWCIDAPEAYVGAQAVYRSEENLLRRVLGDELYEEVAEYMEKRYGKPNPTPVNWQGHWGVQPPDGSTGIPLPMAPGPNGRAKS